MKVSFSIVYILGGAIFASLFFLRCSSAKEAQISPLGDFVSPAEGSIEAKKIELGRKLFFDKRLSINETVSCATCHVPKFAFTDRKKVSDGVLGRKTDRNSPSILNSRFLPTVMFDAHIQTLEMQIIVPIQEHVEMDMDMLELIKRLRKDTVYQNAAKKIFNRDFDPFVLTRSIAAFERSLISDNSRFDQFYYQKKKNALSKSEKNGWKLFSEKLYCTTCHSAPHFTNFQAENNGLYLDYGKDKGRFRINEDSADIGMFKVPSLRNVELTFPYMHDGSIETLEDVIDHYKKGGNRHPLQSKIITSFQITNEEKRDLVNFLKALTDTIYLKNFP